MRPAVVVGLPEVLGEPRYPLMMLAPLTTDHGQAWALRSPALYPRLSGGTGGLRVDSFVLLDQLRALDEARMAGYLGALPNEAYEPIREGSAPDARPGGIARADVSAPRDVTIDHDYRTKRSIDALADKSGGCTRS